MCPQYADQFSMLNYVIPPTYGSNCPFLRVTSPFTRVGILTNPSYQDEINQCQKLFISDLMSSAC